MDLSRHSATSHSTNNPTEISSANLENSGDVEWHLQYWNEDKGVWAYVTTTYVTYNEGGRSYPAYCLNREYPRSWRI